MHFGDQFVLACGRWYTSIKQVVGTLPRAREGRESYCLLSVPFYRVSHLLGAIWYISVWMQKARGTIVPARLDQAGEGPHASLVHHCGLQGGTALVFRGCRVLPLLASALFNAGSVKGFCSHLGALCSANDRALGFSCWQSGLATVASVRAQRCPDAFRPELPDGIWTERAYSHHLGKVHAYEWI